MTNLDQFESAFKAAAKQRFTDEHVHVRSVLVITDLDDEATQRFTKRARSLLPILVRDDDEETVWTTVAGGEYDGVGKLLQVIGQREPELICTYRNLHTRSTEYPYSLGTYVDVLTQATNTPTLLLPHPALEPAAQEAPRGTKSVMAITDHLTGDHHLVSFAARLTEPDGKLLLAHVEDEATFERYIATIGKIPEIDTEEARESILEQLIKEPTDYIESCRQVLRDEGLPISVEAIVVLGHHLRDYRALIEQNDVDLLVLNAKDDDQLAMHGVAYPLSVELRRHPMLLL